MTTRRDFVGGALAVGAGAVVASHLPETASAAVQEAYSENQRIDLHAHHIPVNYRAALTADGITFIGGIPIPTWSPQEAIAFMDRFGIQLQMLSVSDPGVSFRSGQAAADLARETNEAAAQAVDDFPRRFGAFAVLPPPTDLAAARAEVTYALDTLDHDGVGLLSSYDGKYLGDPAFDQLLADLNQRRCWVFVHPTAVSDNDRPSYQIPNFIAEYPFDTTRAFISLLFNGSFKRYPNIRWQFAHGGGTVPMLQFRLETLAHFAQAVGVPLGLPAGALTLEEDDATRALERAFYDTALVSSAPVVRVSSQAAMEAVRELTSDEHIVFGSDFPFAGNVYTGGSGDPQPDLGVSFDNPDRHRVDRANAVREFPRLASFVSGAVDEDGGSGGSGGGGGAGAACNTALGTVTGVRWRRGRKRRRLLRVRVVLEEKAKVTVRVSRRGRTIVKQVKEFAPGTHVLQLAVPSRTRRGQARLGIAIRDGAGANKHQHREVQVPPRRA